MLAKFYPFAKLGRHSISIPPFLLGSITSYATSASPQIQTCFHDVSCFSFCCFEGMVRQKAKRAQVLGLRPLEVKRLLKCGSLGHILLKNWTKTIRRISDASVCQACGLSVHKVGAFCRQSNLECWLFFVSIQAVNVETGITGKIQATTLRSRGSRRQTASLALAPIYRHSNRAPVFQKWGCVQSR